MESPSIQTRKRLMSSGDLHQSHQDTASEISSSSQHSTHPEQTVSNQHDVTFIAPDNTTETHVQDNGAENSDRVHEINTFLSHILDNLQEQAQDAPTGTELSSSSPNEPRRNIRRSESRNIELVCDLEGNECPSKSAPSPSVGAEYESSPKSSVSSDEEQRGVMNELESAKVAKSSIKDILDLSTVKIDFGANFPGMALEESLEISNKSDKDVIVHVTIKCLNQECQKLDGYVYSLRQYPYFNVSDTHEVVISANSSESFTVLFKTPRMKIKDEIVGEIQISAKGIEGTEKVDISSSLYIPKVICPKELYSKENKCSIVKLAINRKGKKLDTKFSLKNQSEVPLTLDLSFYQPKNLEEDPELEWSIFPSSVTIPPNGLSIVNIGLRNSKAVAKRTDLDGKSVKKMMVGTVENTALIYSFPLCIDLY